MLLHACLKAGINVIMLDGVPIHGSHIPLFGMNLGIRRTSFIFLGVGIQQYVAGPRPLSDRKLRRISRPLVVSSLNCGKARGSEELAGE